MAMLRISPLSGLWSATKSSNKIRMLQWEKWVQTSYCWIEDLSRRQQKLPEHLIVFLEKFCPGILILNSDHACRILLARSYHLNFYCLCIQTNNRFDQLPRKANKLSVCMAMQKNWTTHNIDRANWRWYGTLAHPISPGWQSPRGPHPRGVGWTVRRELIPVSQLWYFALAHMTTFQLHY